LHIGAVARQANVSIDAVRFYERSDILATAPRTSGGFRTYSEEDVTALRFIRRAQNLGFTLPQIRELLALRLNDTHACGAVRERLETKRDEVQMKIRQLQQIDRELRAAMRKCRRQLRKRCPQCPVLKGATGRLREVSP